MTVIHANFPNHFGASQFREMDSAILRLEDILDRVVARLEKYDI